MDYITALMTKALDAATGPNQRITVEDILFVLRKVCTWSVFCSTLQLSVRTQEEFVQTGNKLRWKSR